MIKKITHFVAGALFMALVCSACLNVILYERLEGIGYTQVQRDQMDALAKTMLDEEGKK